MLARASILLLLTLGALCPSCRIPERDSLILMPDKGMSESVVVTTFIDVVKAHYAKRDDGGVSILRKDGGHTQIDFTYAKVSPEGHKGERIILSRGEVIRKLEDEDSNEEPSGYIHTYRVEATYLQKGINAHVAGLAKQITERVQEGISLESNDQIQPANY